MNKFRAIKTQVDGIVFHSKKESLRYRELLLLFRAGQIFDLAIQPEYEFKLNGKRMFKYIADFSYTDGNGENVTEDVKGVKTAVYKIKKKIIEASHGIKITEI